VSVSWNAALTTIAGQAGQFPGRHSTPLLAICLSLVSAKQEYLLAEQGRVNKQKHLQYESWVILQTLRFKLFIARIRCHLRILSGRGPQQVSNEAKGRHFNQQEAFEKCWAHSPLRAAARRLFYIAIHQVSLLSHSATVAHRLRLDVHNNNDDNNDNA